MSKTLVSLLVGMHFKPPAKQVLAHLPAGAALRLEGEPENPYDPEALKVLVAFEAVPEAQLAGLEESLEGTGFTTQDLADLGEIWLGYVAASGGKPLAKAGLEVGNAEFNSALQGSPDEAKATLVFGPDGSPRVSLEVPG